MTTPNTPAADHDVLDNYDIFPTAAGWMVRLRGVRTLGFTDTYEEAEDMVLESAIEAEDFWNAVDAANL